MASNRICKVVTCPRGGQQIVCARAWLWNGGDAWACLLGKHVMRSTGGRGVSNYYHAPSGTFVSVLPVTQALQDRFVLGDAIQADSVELTAVTVEEQKKNYTALKVAAVLVLLYLGYKHFKK